MNNNRPNVESDFLARLDSLTDGGMGVSYQEFERILREDASSISFSSLHQILNIAGDQWGFWEAEWLFSPADSPNDLAKTETEGWPILWRGICDKLVENVPDTRELLEKEQNLKVLQHLLQRGVEYNETRPFRKYTALILSKISFVLNKIGLHGFAENLYAWGLYPKGTVARP